MVREVKFTNTQIQQGYNDFFVIHHHIHILDILQHLESDPQHTARLTHLSHTADHCQMFCTLQPTLIYFTFPAQKYILVFITKYNITSLDIPQK